MESELKKFSDILPKIKQNYIENQKSDKKKVKIILNKFYARPFTEEIMEEYDFWYDVKSKELYWYDKDEGIWRESAEDFIRNFFRKSTETLRDEQKRVYVLNEIVNDVRDLAYKNISLPEPPKVLIPFKNGVFDLETDEFRDFQEDDYFTWKLPHRYNPNSKNTFLIETIHSFLENSISLFELLAYCLWRGYEYQKLFILFGRGSNGKTTFAHILEGLLGKENVTHISMGELQRGRFCKAQLYRKLANISGELEYQELKNTGLLKQLCGEDSITAEKKFKDAFEFRNYAKLIFLTNEIPKSLDTTEAFYRRIFLIEFPKQFPQNPSFLQKINNLSKEEYEALLLVVLKYLKDLKRRGFVFSQDNTEKMRKEYIRLSNPLSQFIEENCLITHSREDFIYKYEFNERFQRWLAEKGRTMYSEKRLNNEMKELGLGEGRRGEKKWYCWLGLKWKS